MLISIRCAALAVLAMAIPSMADAPTGGTVFRKQLKIVGGYAARTGEFPFIANLQVQGFSFCGGVIIHPKWILTAAHCLVNPVTSKPKNANVLYDINTFALNLGQVSNSTATPVRPLRLVPHPLYSFKSSHYDGGLIELAEPLVFNEQIQAARLVDNVGNLSPDQLFTVAGWGRNEANQKSPFMQRVDLPSVSEETCTRAQSDYPKRREQLLCVGNSQGKDSCRGDSGGPLLIQGTAADGTTGAVAASAWMVAGITSIGANSLGLDANLCGVAGAVGFYTRSDFVASWIAETTQLPLSSFAAPLPERFRTKSDASAASADDVSGTNSLRPSIGGAGAGIIGAALFVLLGLLA